MHPDLEILLEIQDLKTQRKELEGMTTERQVEEEVFNITIEDALLQLDEKIGEMEGSLSPPCGAGTRGCRGGGLAWWFR